MQIIKELEREIKGHKCERIQLRRQKKKFLPHGEEWTALDIRMGAVSGLINEKRGQLESLRRRAASSKTDPIHSGSGWSIGKQFPGSGNFNVEQHVA
ncbi:hypothetical protein KC730_01215 [Candidatus Kaiserbacteria bacterium]|nr:hypothetical protein [Candidatus Kaiserbacteria bacterium]